MRCTIAYTICRKSMMERWPISMTRRAWSNPGDVCKVKVVNIDAPETGPSNEPPGSRGLLVVLGISKWVREVGQFEYNGLSSLLRMGE